MREIGTPTHAAIVLFAAFIKAVATPGNFNLHSFFMAIQLDDKSTYDLESGVPAQKKSGSTFRILKYVFATVVLMVYFTQSAPQCVSSFFTALTPAPALPVEVVEVTLPVDIPVAANHSQLLFNESLANGLSTKIQIPKSFNYSEAFLTLNFTNVGVDTPLVEVAVDGAAVWRSSTPAARLGAVTKSSTFKNVTEVLPLFAHKKTVTVTVLEGDVTGIDFSLELTLLDTPEVPHSLFSFQGPASKVIPFDLVEASTLSLQLPQVEANTTAARLSLFASASEKDVSFFLNDISATGGSPGPLRFLNVFANTVFVGTVFPKPTLFHPEALSDVADAWVPLADVGSLTGLSYEIDLVAILPLLWESPVSLDVVVVDPVQSVLVDDIEGPVSTAAAAGHWFLSSKLLTWEDASIVESSGDSVFASTEKDSGVLIEPPAVSPWQPSIKNEIVKSKVKANATSLFNFTLTDNTTLSYSLGLNTSSFAVLTKTSKTTKALPGKPATGSTNLVLTGGVETKYEFQDLATGIITTKKISVSHPLTFTESTGTKDSALIKLKLEFKGNFNGTKVSFKADETVTSGVSTVAEVKVKLDADGTIIENKLQAINGKLVKA